MTTKEEFLESYLLALRDLNAAVFAGAGLSIPGGLVNWKQLMRSIAADVHLDVEKEHDLIAVAQFHENTRRGRHRLNALLVHQFASRGRVTDNHRILARLPVQTYWTTNYDTLIETALSGAGKKPDVKVTESALAQTLSRRDAVVYKMHGDVSDPGEAVVTKDDYEAYRTTSRGELFATALKGDLVSKTFFFLGFSFDDPNLTYVLSRIRVLLGANRREHYSLIRRVQKGDFKRKAEYEYAKTKQDLQVDDLKRYGIMAVMLDDYSEYTELLIHLEKRYKATQVFVSGSAKTYAPLSENTATSFLTRLGRALIKEGMNVVTGFGLGVGPHIINGVLDELENQGTRSLSDRLVMRPFPYAITNQDERSRRWLAYRVDMLSGAGVAVFVFGNKESSDGKVIDADGVIKEFEIARSLGLLIVAVGATGSVATKLHAQIEKDFHTYYPKVPGLKSAFKALGHAANASEMVDRVVSFIKLAIAG